MPDTLDLKQSRKWMVTINNPLEHGFDHDAIKGIMSKVRGVSLYWCMLNYLDGYPLLLPCRYFNRQACFTKVTQRDCDAAAYHINHMHRKILGYKTAADLFEAWQSTLTGTP